jgi:outer membrane protein OmpA-like peptidoglycan-associated protein
VKTLFVLLLATVAAVAQRPTREVHTFDQAPLYWSFVEEYHDPQFDRTYEKGAMHIRKRSSVVNWMYKSLPLDRSKDWEVTMRVRVLSADGTGGPGIHIWAPDANYMFKIAGAMRAYWVGSVTSAGLWDSYGASKTRGADVPSDVIRPIGEANDLAVRKRGTTIQFVINGTNIEEFSTESMGSMAATVNSLGLNVSQRCDVEVEEMTFTYVQPSFKVDVTALLGATKTYVENLNAKMADRYPIIAPNGASIYFVRSTDRVSDDIYVASRETDSTWTNVRPIEGRLNNADANNVMAVSQDDNELYLWGRYGPNGAPAGVGFSKTRRTANGWEGPTNVIISNYQNRATTREECISADRTVAIMACQRDETQGLKDLYVSFLQPDGSYSEPANLGAVLNSPFNEGMPYLAADNRTLYFGSSRPGYGDDDIWVSKRLDSTWRNWSEPINMGPTVNTNAWDGYFSIHPSGRYAYMNSSDGRRTGIMRLRLPQTKQSAKLLPDPTVLVRGRVIDAKTKRPIATAVEIRDLRTDAGIATARSEPGQGRYSIVLTPGRSYGFYASEQGYYPVSANLDLRKLASYREAEQDLELWPIEVGATVRLNNVFFDTDRSNIRSESRDELQRLIALLRSRPTMRIEIGGHTDDRGSDEHNTELSEARALSVRRYLESNGIESARLQHKGYGKTRPVAEGRDASALQQNRRVEFTIVGL